MKEISIEPLKGEDGEKRLVLDRVSEVVFVLDFIKLRWNRKVLLKLLADPHGFSLIK